MFRTCFFYRANKKYIFFFSFLFFYLLDVSGQNSPFFKQQPVDQQTFEVFRGPNQTGTYMPFNNDGKQDLKQPVLRGPEDGGDPIGGLPVSNGLWILSFLAIAYYIVKIVIRKKDKKHLFDRYLLSLVFCSCAVYTATAQHDLYGLWAKKVGVVSQNDDITIQQMMTDSNGNFYVCGYYRNTVSLSGNTCDLIHSGGYPHTAPGYSDYPYGGYTYKGAPLRNDGFITKYDALGHFEWTVRIVSNVDDNIPSMVLSNDENTIVILARYGCHQFTTLTPGTCRIYYGNGGSETLTYNTPANTFCNYSMIRLNTSNGTKNSLTYLGYGINTGNTPNTYFWVDNISTDAAGNLYMQYENKPNGYTDGYCYNIRKYNPSGTTILSENLKFLSKSDIDIHTTFVSKNQNTDNLYTIYRTNIRGSDENCVKYVAKINRNSLAMTKLSFISDVPTAGAATTYPYHGINDRGIDVNNGETHLFVCGYTRYTFLYRATNTTITNAGGDDGIIVCYNPASTTSNIRWMVNLRAPGNQRVNDCLYDHNTSTLKVVGYIDENEVDFNPLGSTPMRLRSASGTAMFYAVYSSSGICQYVKLMDSPGDAQGQSVGLSSNRRVNVFGTFTGSSFQPDPSGRLHPLRALLPSTFLAQYSTNSNSVQLPVGPASFSAADNVSSAYGQAWNEVQPCIQLGAENDAITMSEAANYTPYHVSGTNTNANPNYDGYQSHVVGTPSGGMTVTVKAINDKETPAYLMGWIDFNENGVFDENEASGLVMVPANTSALTNFDLIWPIPSLPIQPTLDTYMRVRITSEKMDATWVDGDAVDGEVEDYRLNLLIGGPQYYACPDTEVTMVMPLVENASYNWYNSPSGGQLLSSGTNTYTITKNITDDIESFWVEKVYITGPEPYRYKIDVKLVPDLMYWKKTATNNNWNDPLNWVDVDDNLLYAIPRACTDVHIPGNAANYPSLDETNTPRNIYGMPVCNDITYHFGGEVAKPHYLTYHHAYVHYNFGYYETDKAGGAIINGDISHSATPMNRDRWYALSAPLKKIVTGDFSVGGFPNMWQRGFRTSLDRTTDLVGEWYVPENIMALEIGARQNYAVSVYAACYTSGLLGEKDHTNLNGLKGIFEIPYFENTVASGLHRLHQYDSNNQSSRFYYYYYKQEGLPIEYNAYDDFARGEEAYRFIFEDINNAPQTDFKIKVLITDNNDDGQPDEIMIGNPFISSLDFGKFYTLNTSKIENYYRLYTVGNFETYTSTIRPLIAPMQAFFIKPKGTIGSEVEVSFTAAMSVLRTSAHQLKSNKGSEIGNMLKISAENEVGNSWILLASGSDGESDITRLFSKDLKKTPQIYSCDAELNKNTIQYVGSDEQIPLGIRSEYNGQFRLMFDNIENFPVESLWLYDKELNQEYDLFENNVYPFENTSGDLSSRFILNVGKKAPSGFENNVVNKTNIYFEGKTLYINSNEKLDRIQIFNIQGLSVFLKSEMNTSHFSEEMNILAGVYIVVVRLETGESVTGKILVR